MMQTTSLPPPSYSADRLEKLASLQGKRTHRLLLSGALIICVALGGATLALQNGVVTLPKVSALSSSFFSSTTDLSHRIGLLEADRDTLRGRLTQAEEALAVLRSAGEHTTHPQERIFEPISEQLRRNRLAVAVLQLRITSQTHRPFAAELAIVRQLGGKEAALIAAEAALAPYAAMGVATVAELRDGFGLILLPKLQPMLEESDQSWVDWAFGWMNLVLIPFYSLPPTPQQQLIISATTRLTEDDLAGAVELIAQLDGPAAALVVRWLKEANARLAVDAAYNSLSGIVVALLGHTP